MTEPGVPPEVAPSTLPENNWGRYSIGHLWAMLEHESRASGEVAAQMWERIRAVCDLEADMLDQALARLADHWPMTQDSAIAFQRWGTELVAAMRDTAGVAARSGWAVDMITQEIAVAKGRMGDLMGEYLGYLAVEQQNPTMASTLATNLLHAGRRLFSGEGLTPLTAMWRTTLPAEAREVMVDLERKIAIYSTIVRWDVPFQPQLSEGIELPPVPTTPAGGGGGGAGGGGLPAGGSAWRTPLPDIPPPPTLPAPGSPGGWTPADPPEFDDPILDGDTELGGAPTAPGAGGLPSGGGGGFPGGVGSGPPARGVGGAFVDTPAGRVLAPGVVIGAPGAGGVGTVPGSVAGPRGGAVSAGTGATGRPAGGPGMMPIVPPMMAGQPGSAGATGAAASRRARRGLPSVFETPEGPPAVIRPPEEPEDHHPGPGVIGIDR